MDNKKRVSAVKAAVVQRGPGAPFNPKTEKAKKGKGSYTRKKKNFRDFREEVVTEAESILSKIGTPSGPGKKYIRDPLYANILKAETPEALLKAMKTLESIRGKAAVKELQAYVRSQMSEEVVNEENCNCDCGEDPCVTCGKSHHAEDMSESINVELKKSKHGPTYKAIVSGSVGKIGIEGESTQYLHGTDELDSSLVRKILQNRIRRSDGYGKPITAAISKKVEAAVLSKLQSIKESFDISENKEQWGKVFDNLKKGDKISVQWQAVMSSSPKEPVTLVAIRKSHSKKYGVTKWVLSRDGSAGKSNRMNTLYLYQRGGAGNAPSMAIGDMGVSLTHLSKAVNESTLDERSLTDDEKGKKERYVKGMKKKFSGFRDRYGEDAKSVMYGTATNMAKEEVELDEAKAKMTNIDRLKKIVDESQAASLKFKDGSMKVDLFSASAVLKVLEAVNDANKKKITDLVNTGSKGMFIKIVNLAFGK
jgi:stalled ribosome alternative rescue factor ArfA